MVLVFNREGCVTIVTTGKRRLTMNAVVPLLFVILKLYAHANISINVG